MGYWVLVCDECGREEFELHTAECSHDGPVEQVLADSEQGEEQ